MQALISVNIKHLQMEDNIKLLSVNIVLKQCHRQQQDLSVWEKGFTEVFYQF